MAELRQVDAAEVDRRLAALVGGEGQIVDEARWHWREATALVGCFRTGDLEEGDAEPTEALRQFVLEDAEPVVTPDGPRWRLQATVREETLRRLAQQDRLQAARSTLPSGSTDVTRVMAEAYLLKSAPPLNRQTVSELHGTLQAAEWLRPTGLPLPHAADVRAHLDRANLLEPLRMLVADGFVGRTKELAQLHAHVEPAPARRRRRKHGTGTQLRPLLIHGPGGIGKSTLVARFVMEYATLADEHRIPLVYLSFDRPDLRADAPLTLLAEAARQIGAQYPSLVERARSIADSALGVHRAYVATRTERAPSAKSTAARRQRTGADQSDIVRRLARLLSDTGSSDRPMLVVLDTFEVAQRSGPEAVERVWGMLGQLAHEMHRVRIVIAGRAPIDGREVEDLPLGALAPDEALALLRARLGDMKVPDSFLRSATRKVGANPLSVRLVAELLRREGESGLRGVSSRRRILFKLSAEEIQGMLYRRILDHLPDEDLQQIANPGLVVRRITPDVIQHVLATPCGLGNIDSARAKDLFDRLALEAALVQRIDQDTVVHRSDVRRVMLPLLARSDAAKVDEIHRRAVAWFREQPGVEAKTEELYHRLALGQASSTLDEAWDGDAAVALEDVLDELPPSSQAFLADRLEWPVDPAVLAAAEDETWARQATRTARNLLDDGRPTEALALLQLRRNPTVRPLTTPLMVEALAAAKDPAAAVALVESSLQWATEEDRWTTYLDLELLGARVAEDAGRYDRALKWLQDARDVAGDVNDAAVHLAAGVAMVRIHRRSNTAPASDALRQEVLNEASALSGSELDRNPTLLRDLAAEFGSEHPEFTRRAAKVAGLDTESPAGEALTRALSQEQQENLASFAREQLGDKLEEEGIVSPPTGGAGADLSWLARQTAVEQGQVIGEYLESSAGDESWNKAVAEAYQAESDSEAF